MLLLLLFCYQNKVSGRGATTASFKDFQTVASNSKMLYSPQEVYLVKLVAAVGCCHNTIASSMVISLLIVIAKRTRSAADSMRIRTIIRTKPSPYNSS